MKHFLPIILLLGALSCKTQKATQDEVALLKEQMAGFYSSEEQSIRDKDYFNISLRMVPIWQDKGHYLWVEQAMFEKQNAPYRTRIYKLSKNEKGNFVSEIYTIKNEKEWIGKWKTPEAFNALTLNDIELKQGCEVIMEKITNNQYKGKTGEKSCASELRGASYATSIVNLYDGKIESWDQGFNKEGKQVWGAEKGGYIFIKRSE